MHCSSNVLTSWFKFHCLFPVVVLLMHHSYHFPWFWQAHDLYSLFPPAFLFLLEAWDLVTCWPNNTSCLIARLLLRLLHLKFLFLLIHAASSSSSLLSSSSSSSSPWEAGVEFLPLNNHHIFNFLSKNSTNDSSLRCCLSSILLVLLYSLIPLSLAHPLNFQLSIWSCSCT